MAPRSSLLGPPELHNPTLLPKLRKIQSLDNSEAINDPFMNLMVLNFNRTDLPPQIDPPPMGTTEKGSGTYTSSGNPCLDLFFHVVPDTKPDSIRQRLQNAWNDDSMSTLKLICNLRGVRGTGKSDKEGFYTAALWLHQFHPKTLACNLPSIANFGYLKDLPEILYRILEGSDVRKNQKAEWERRKCGGRRKRRRSQTFTGPFQRPKGSKKSKSRRIKKPESTRQLRISNALERDKEDKEKARFARIEKKVAMAKKVYERYNKDPDFRFLYERVSEFFADCLKADVEHLKSDQIAKVSLAAKWCPSIDSSFDKSMLLCESIARKVFPRESYPEYEGVEEAHYAYRVRDRLRKEVLVPLRKVLELPEVYIGQNKWAEIPYNRVPSTAMKLYKMKFFKHDKERFSKYLKEAKTAAAGAMLPVETIRSMDDDDGGQVAELQRKRMVADVHKQGKLKNCMAICDVSRSMNGTPMEVSLTLGVIVSELSEEPWSGKLITFSENPALQKVRGDNLIQKTGFARTMEWGKNTNLQKVFDLILQVAVNGKLKEDEMIKRLFVFSDMEFDKASSTYTETDYQVMVRKFTEKGYGNAIPEVLFWNVRDSRATPVPATQKGVAMVSGFSKNLMKMFLDWNGEMDPVSVMKAAISGEEYQNLAVID